MKKASKSISTYATLGPFTSASYFLIIISGAVLYLSGSEINMKMPIVVITAALALIGLFYNLVIFRFLNKRAEFVAKYLQMFFLVASCGVVAFLSGGVNSPWYLALLFAIIICSVLGYGAIYINLFLLTLFFGADIVFNFLNNPDISFQFRVFPFTIAALVCAWLVAYSTESLKKAKANLTKYGSQISSVKLSEQAILKSIADPLIRVDRDLKITLMNQAAQALSGWDSSEATGLGYVQVFNLRSNDEQPVSDVTDPFLFVLKNKSVLQTEKYHMIRSKDKLRIPLEISIAPSFDLDGNAIAATAIIRDVSKKQALEREKNEFVSTASHEMRTPVAAIEGYIAMATNPNISTIDGRARGFLDKAHESALHLGKLFQDLLSVSKIEDKAVKDERVLFNLVDLVLKVATEFKPIASAKNINLSTHVGGSTQRKEKIIIPAMPIYANPERIREVLTNLVDNAIKYTDSGSVDIKLSSGEGTAAVEVTDTGIGISKEEQKHIFEKFYRVNNELTREHSGTGLGLYISRNIVEMYGGNIWVRSETEHGSTFGFSLPLVKKVAN